MEIVSIKGATTDNDRQDHKESVTSVTLKGSVFTLPIVKLHLSNLVQVSQDLQTQLDAAPGFFKNSPVIVDLSLVQEHTIDFASLKILLKGYELVPVGIQSGSELQQLAAVGQGLGIIPARSPIERVASSNKGQNSDAPSQAGMSSQSSAPNEETALDVDEEQEPNLHEFVEEETQVATLPIRSGQRLYARGGDLIQLAAVNPGAEIMADGNIHVYAPLRGRALAGVNGNENARIFCHSFEAELVAIAGNYRVFEDSVPPDLFKKPVEIYLQKEQLIIRSIT